MMQSCPGCGKGSYANLDNRAYSAHCRGCSRVLFKPGGDDTGPNEEQNNNMNSNRNGYSNPPIIQVEIDPAVNPCHRRGLLQAYLKDNRETHHHFDFSDNDDDRWEGENDKAPDI